MSRRCSRVPLSSLVPVSFERFFSLLNRSFLRVRAKETDGFLSGVRLEHPLTVLEDDSELEEFRLRFLIEEKSKTRTVGVSMIRSTKQGQGRSNDQGYGEERQAANCLLTWARCFCGGRQKVYLNAERRRHEQQVSETKGAARLQCMKGQKIGAAIPRSVLRHRLNLQHELLHDPNSEHKSCKSLNTTETKNAARPGFMK